MDILIIPSWYSAFPGVVNGCFFREQALAVKRQGHEVGVIDFQPRYVRTQTASRSVLATRWRVSPKPFWHVARSTGGLRRIVWAPRRRLDEINGEGYRPHDCEGDLSVMTKQLRPALPEPAGTSALRPRYSDQEKGSGFLSQVGSMCSRQRAGCMAAVYIPRFANKKAPCNVGESKICAHTKVKALCKEFGFTTGMLKGALAEGRKKK